MYARYYRTTAPKEIIIKNTVKRNSKTFAILQVMFEERIERLNRPSPPMIALGPRSSHDKSGDSGISGDAGAANDDSLDVSTMNRIKTPAMRPTWTPQQDLGEESSSDAGVDSPPPMSTPIKFPSRGHVFSLSLPREENRQCLYSTTDAKSNGNGKEATSFNSLQKLKRSLSGALGLAPLELERNKSTPGDALDDNWLLSSSAPTSLQHSKIGDVGSANNKSATAAAATGNWEDLADEPGCQEKSGVGNDFPAIMKPPSFSYLATGGHVMYLPDSNGNNAHQSQSLDYRGNGDDRKVVNGVAPAFRRVHSDDPKRPYGIYSSLGANINDKDYKKANGNTKDKLVNLQSRKLTNFSKSCENISSSSSSAAMAMATRGKNGHAAFNGPENLQDDNNSSSKDNESKAQPPKQHSKSRRFTFQSTVRQIERRRLAEKLSKEAEAKERQRKGELEAMRKVEEEFQRKRAREKANIRQQLRLYSMDENIK